MTIILWSVILAGAVALFGALCALTACTVGKTRPAIYGAFLLIAWGWGITLFAAGDILWHAHPLMGETFMPVGVALLAIGNAVLYLASRRGCKCHECPGRVGTVRRPQVIDWRAGL